MQLCRVSLFLALMLLLCGDIEVNPGPQPQNIKSVFPILGNFHQGDEKFSPYSRGRQCVPCCIVFIIKLFLKPFEVHEWQSADIDQILIEGDFVYKFSKKTSNHSKHFLEPCDLPPFIEVNNVYFSWKVKNTYSGSIHKNFTGVYPLVKLEVALAMGLSKDFAYCIFVCKEKAVAISS